MDAKTRDTTINKYAEQRQTQFEINEIIIGGKTCTVINAFPIESDATVEDRLRYLVRVS